MMLKRPKISVIIPCFNAALWIRETLRSVFDQGLEEIEIIVVDDGSTDDSARIIKDEFPSVRLIETENGGPSRARNIGTELASGEFIQYLDADDLLAPNKFALQIELLERTGVDVAYGDWQKLVRRSDGSFIPGEVFKRVIRNPEIDLFTADAWNAIHSYLFRRSIVEKVGKWNEGLPIIQDARFTLDCALQGASFAYASGIMGYYRIHSTDTVSTHSSIRFVKDCLRNTVEIEEWWKSHGDISNDRQEALLKAYGFVARASFKNDKDTFEIAYQALERLSGGYIPESPKHLRFAAKLLGYRRAEALALNYRRVKLLLT